MTKKEILIRIDGCVETNLTHDEWLDQFIEWLESRSECFGGGTEDVTEEGLGTTFRNNIAIGKALM